MKWQIIKPKNPRYRLKVTGSLGVIIVAQSGQSEVVVELDQAGAKALVLGIIESQNNDDLKLRIVTVHQAANTHAETMIHGLVSDQAQVQIKGLIQIKKNAQQVTDFLTERVLLLSENARAVAEPELEIEADEVRASHAATVSSLNKDELFYLMSRGVNRQEAERLITAGFIAKVLNRIDNDKIRKQVASYVKH
jgi:Fe-S cluster assembly protein SufD